MSGKTYVGNSSGKAYIPSRIYFGNTDGKAQAVKAIYVGNANDIAEKVWPSSIIPSDRYTQVEYLGGITFELSDSDLQLVNNPRFVIEFEPTKPPSYNQYLLGSQVFDEDSDNDSYEFSFGLSTFSYEYFHLNYISGRNTDATDQARVYLKNEDIIPGLRYTLDFNNISGSTSRFYLRAPEEYYSIASHQLVLTRPTMSFKAKYGTLAPLNIILLGCSTFPPGGYGCENVRLYRCEIYSKTNRLIRDYYPCYRKSDGVVGLYDIVDNRFLASRGGVTKDKKNIEVGPVVE